MSLPVLAWIAIGLATFASVLTLYRHRDNALLVRIYSTTEYFLLRFLFYSRFRSRAVAVALLIGVNTLILSYKTTVEGVALRSAIVSIANLIFLVPSPIHRLTKYFRSSLPVQMFLHECFGWITIVHGLIHSIYYITSQKQIVLKEQTISGISVNLYGIGCSLHANNWKAALASCVIGVLCVLFYFNIWYGIFFRSHQILSPALLVGLWFHIRRGRNLSTLLLALASLVWAVSKLCQLVTMIRTSGSTVTVLNDHVGLRLTMARPKKFLYGQYVFLRFPRIQMFGRHPFLVIPSQDQRVTHVLAVPQNGTTEHLSNIAHRVTAFFDGPFGSGIDFRPYGKVVMVATREGIINLIPYIHAILDDHRRYKNTTRHIIVHWAPENSVVHNLIGPEMDKLLKLDVEEGSTRDGLPSEQARGNQIKQYLLDIFVYGSDRHGDFGARNRIHMRCGEPNLDEILRDEVERDCKVAYFGKGSDRTALSAS